MATGEKEEPWPPFNAKQVVEMPWSDPVEIRYDRRDVLIYNIGVGCTDLRFLYERHPKFCVFPTFPIRFSGAGAWDRFPRTTPGLNIDGERYMELLRPLPTKGGKLFARSRVVGFHDKGRTEQGRHKGAVVEFETSLMDEAGEEVCKLVNGEFFRGVHTLGDIGEFEGAGVTYSQNISLPDRPPDFSISLPIANNAAQIYRLSGDYMPHHIDPAAAKRVGYDRVILHGLCTLGHVTGALLTNLCDNEVNRFRKVKVRFAAPVYLGEQLSVEGWHAGPGRVLFRVVARDRGDVCVNNAYFEYEPVAASAKL